MASWDTFGLFDGLSSDFGQHLRTAVRITFADATYPSYIEAGLRLSLVGYSLFCPMSEWSVELTDFIVGRLEGELSPKSLDWYEETAEAYAMFSCLALGALLGKSNAGEIGEREYLLGEAHLPGYLLSENQLETLRERIDLWKRTGERA